MLMLIISVIISDAGTRTIASLHALWFESYICQNSTSSFKTVKSRNTFVGLSQNEVN